MTARTGKPNRPNGKPTLQSLGAELAALKKRFHIEAREHDLHVVELSKREADLDVIFAAIAAPQDMAADARARWTACRINSLRAKYELDQKPKAKFYQTQIIIDATKRELPSLAEMNATIKAATAARQAADRDSKPVVGA